MLKTEKKSKQTRTQAPLPRFQTEQTDSVLLSRRDLTRGSSDPLTGRIAHVIILLRSSHQTRHPFGPIRKTETESSSKQQQNGCFSIIDLHERRRSANDLSFVKVRLFELASQPESKEGRGAEALLSVSAASSLGPFSGPRLIDLFFNSVSHLLADVSPPGF